MLAREFSVFGAVALALGCLGAACGTAVLPIESSTQQSAADAQATHVRRTALAEVQQIIANPRQATATPQPTRLPRPSCADGIWWHEARAHLNEVRTIQGPVLSSHPAAAGQAVLDIGQPYPDPLGLAVVTSTASAQTLVGKTVCVVGRITAEESRPTLVRQPERIMVAD